MFDYILVGGGLQSSLLVLALRAYQPQAAVALVEQGNRLGGNHTWCFHQNDLDDADRAWMEPLVSTRWPGYDVRFPDGNLHIERQYAAITSAQLHDVTCSAMRHQDRLLCNSRATALEATSVTLHDGTRLEARVVIDARGPHQEDLHSDQTGYQKFFGVEFALQSPHDLRHPILMDACVNQEDGFRFFYVLPLRSDRVLVEETFFSDSADLSIDRSRREILAYATRAGIDTQKIVREEQGILPMPWSAAAATPDRSPLSAGYRGGFYHPATGYSLPIAVRLATLIAKRDPEQLFNDDVLQHFWNQHQKQVAFCHRLNAMLFQWFAPSDRWHVYRRFYGLPQETIDRFYALQLTAIDQGRLLLGRPPKGFSVRYRLSRGVAS